jgi:hypothetical protein
MRQFFGNHKRPAAGLPGNGDRPANPVFRVRPGFAGELQLAADEGETGINTAGFNHNDLRICGLAVPGWESRCLFVRPRPVATAGFAFRP